MIHLNNIRYIMFGGGGFKGICHIGVWSMINIYYTFRQQKTLYNQINGFGGTSIGAFMSLLCLFNVPFDDILVYFRLIHQHIIPDPCFQNNKYQLLSKEPLKLILYEIVKKWGKVPNPETCTFAQLYDIIPKQLHVGVCNVIKRSHVFLGTCTTPDYNVCQSIIASMSVPFIFSPEKIGPYLFVDGGIIDNNYCYLYPPEQILTIHFSEILANYKNSDSNTITSSYLQPINFRDYIFQVLNIPMYYIERQNTNSLTVIQKQNTINIPVYGFILDFKITRQKENELLWLGVVHGIYLFIKK